MKKRPYGMVCVPSSASASSGTFPKRNPAVGWFPSLEQYGHPLLVAGFQEQSVRTGYEYP